MADGGRFGADLRPGLGEAAERAATGTVRLREGVGKMDTHRIVRGSAVVAAVVALLVACVARTSSKQGAGPSPATDGDDITGVVTGPNGPEAGVWVIAETSELPTKYAKIVVTDDRGQYTIPDLPSAMYDVWV